MRASPNRRAAGCVHRAIALLVFLLARSCGTAGAVESDPVLAVCLRDGSQRPTHLDAFRDTPHFRIHYTLTGEDRIPDPPGLAVLDTMAVCLETAWRRFHVDLGFRVPRSDGDHGGGPSGLVDFYIMSLPSSGSAGSDGLDSVIVEGCPQGFSGFARVNRYRLHPSGLQGLVAHEYFHLIQYGYGIGEWWSVESGAVWAEQQVVPGPFGQFPATACWFRTPYLELGAYNGPCRQYGCVHYWLFLEEYLGATFLHDAMERSCRETLAAALREEVSRRGGDWLDVHARFAIWNACTGERDDGRHYRLGADLPDIALQAEHRLYPVVDASLPEMLLARWTGSNYIRFHGPGSTETLRIEFDGDPAARSSRAVSFLVQRIAGACEETTLTPDDGGDCTYEVAAWSDCSDVTMIVTNLDPAAASRAYTYRAIETGSSTSAFRLGPNPSPGSVRCWIPPRFDGTDAVLSVVDALGRRVRTVDLHVTSGTTISWDAMDGNGRIVPAGRYWLLLESHSATTKAPVLIIR